MRFGAEYVAAALAAENRRIVVVDDSEVDDGLMPDMTELMISLCARLHGRRSAANRRPRQSKWRRAVPERAVVTLADPAATEAARAAPTKKRSPRTRFVIPDGWVTRGFVFEVTLPDDPEAASRVRPHFGARRFAYNWALAQVKAGLDAKKAAGFPTFKSRHKDRARVRFTTGSIRVEPDRRTVALLVVRALRSKESTRRLERLVATGRGHILSATMSERWGRLFVFFSCLVEAHAYPAPATGGRAGVDPGLRVLATIADDSGTITHLPNPSPLRATLTEARRTGLQLSRRIPGSNGHRAAKAELARLDRRTVRLRRETHHQHTTVLADTYGEVVIEDLDLAAMNKGMGCRAFRRSVSDAALGQIRPQLAYKMAWRRTTLTVADRWFASSQVHHICGCRLTEPRKLAIQLLCATTGELVDRDVNAALNLRDWPGHASCGSVGATAPKPGSPAGSGGGLGSDAGLSGTGGGDLRPLQFSKAVPGEAGANPGNRGGTPRRGAA